MKTTIVYGTSNACVRPICVPCSRNLSTVDNPKACARVTEAIVFRDEHGLHLFVRCHGAELSRALPDHANFTEDTIESLTVFGGTNGKGR